MSEVLVTYDGRKKIREILTSFILNYDIDGKKLGEIIIEPYMDVIINILNSEIQKKYPNFQLSVKGGLAIRNFLKEISFKYKNTIDINAVNELLSNFSDYDTTITMKTPEYLLTQQSWYDILINIYTIITNTISVNPIIIELLKKIYSRISEKINDGKKDGFYYIKLTSIPQLYNILPESVIGQIVTEKNNYYEINYKNKNNIYLFYKTDETMMWRPNRKLKLKKNTFSLTPENLPFRFTVKKIQKSEQEGGNKFILSRIFGNFQLYEHDKNTDIYKIIVKEKVKGVTVDPEALSFEILDISVDEDVDILKFESYLGTQLVNKTVTLPNNKKYNIKSSVFNLSNIMYDSYIMIGEPAISKPEKRCKRLWVFLRIYKIIKTQAYNQLLKKYPNYTIEFIENNIQYSSFRDQFASEIPLYNKIKNLESVLQFKGEQLYKLFLKNLKDVCFVKTDDPEVKMLIDKITDFSKLNFSEFINYSLELLDIVNDGSVSRIIKDKDDNLFIEKDIDYFQRILLKENSEIWNNFYKKIVPEKTKFKFVNQGGTRFLEDFKKFKKEDFQIENSILNEIFSKIEKLVKDEIITSYDMDIFTSVNKTSDIPELVNYFKEKLQQKTNISINEKYGWKILNDIESIGIYKKYKKIQNSICNSPAKCNMFYTINDFKNYPTIPQVSIRGNVILKNEKCDLYTVSHVLDINIIDMEKYQKITESKTQLDIKNLIIPKLMINLNSKIINENQYMYLTSLVLHSIGNKKIHSLIRAIFYAFLVAEEYENIININKSNPCENIDNKLFELIPTTEQEFFFLSSIQLTSKDFISISTLKISDVLDEVVVKENILDLHPKCNLILDYERDVEMKEIYLDEEKKVKEVEEFKMIESPPMIDENEIEFKMIESPNFKT